MEKFWIVVSEQKGAAFYPKQHTEEAMAFAEAEKLARVNHGRFFVLECKGIVQKTDVVTHKF